MRLCHGVFPVAAGLVLTMPSLPASTLYLSLRVRLVHSKSERDGEYPLHVVGYVHEVLPHRPPRTSPPRGATGESQSPAASLEWTTGVDEGKHAAVHDDGATEDRCDVGDGPHWHYEADGDADEGDQRAEGQPEEYDD
nr:unnamed protein product [Digitaria exilis]